MPVTMSKHCGRYGSFISSCSIGMASAVSAMRLILWL